MQASAAEWEKEDRSYATALAIEEPLQNAIRQEERKNRSTDTGKRRGKIVQHHEENSGDAALDSDIPSIAALPYAQISARHSKPFRFAGAV
ncbi:hypothetical protein R1flu_022567 [Riccia fluitans]|uniref:Uncharacterized protein n=1 Tax=Riccia fluitans TaxID=41844 RepID=A0ABD1XPM0_9MARC